MPDHRSRPAIKGEGQCSLRGIDWRPGMEDAADRTAAIMGLMGSGLVALGRSGSRIAVTNHSVCERVGRSNARRPACADRCKYLHRQRKQDYGQKILQLPSHRNTHPLPSNHRQSRKSRSGSLHYLACSQEMCGRCIPDTLRLSEFRPYSLTPLGFKGLPRNRCPAQSQSFRRLLEF
jgi:hypothetical protein